MAVYNLYGAHARTCVHTACAILSKNAVVANMDREQLHVCDIIISRMPYKGTPASRPKEDQGCWCTRGLYNNDPRQILRYAVQYHWVSEPFGVYVGFRSGNW